VTRGIDHVAHAVRDLDAAAGFYRRAGFTVSARNRHPPVWGTQNHIVQLHGCYIEILALADTSQTAPHGPTYFSFGAFARDFLSTREGLAMLALQGAGAPDADKFRAADIGDFELFEFAREGIRPDGTAVKLAFSLAFARDPKTPEIGFFSCRHHHPENFWNSEFQNHPNTVTGITSIVLVAENPSDHHGFFSAFTDVRELSETSSGTTIRVPCGEIEIMTPAAFRDRFDTEPRDTRNGARLAALRLGVRDFDVAQELFNHANLTVGPRMGRLIVGPETAFGVTLVFERI
jgi:hypothetical protein